MQNLIYQLGRYCQNAEKHSFYPWKRKHSVCQWHIEIRSELSECRKTQFLSMEEETFCLPMTHRSGCWGCRSDYFRFMLDRQREPKWHNKCCKCSKTTIFNWHINTNHDFYTLHLCTDQGSKWWQSMMRVIGPINCQHFQRPLSVSASVTPVRRNVGAPEGKLETITICKENW